MNPRPRALLAALLSAAALTLTAGSALASNSTASTRSKSVRETNSVAVVFQVPAGTLQPEEMAKFRREIAEKVIASGLVNEDTKIVTPSRAETVVYAFRGEGGVPQFRAERFADAKPAKPRADAQAAAKRKTAAEFFAQIDAQRAANGSDYVANPQMMELDRNTINGSTNTNDSNSPAPPAAMPRQPGTN